MDTKETVSNKFCPDCGKNIAKEVTASFLGIRFCQLCYDKREAIITKCLAAEKEKKKIISSVERRLSTATIQTKHGHKWTEIDGDLEKEHFNNVLCEICRSAHVVGAIKESNSSRVKFICLICTWL